MIDAVLSYHLDPNGCGVAKFNHLLAARLGVPCASIWEADQYQYPLVSVKWAEIPEDEQRRIHIARPYDLLEHDTCTLELGCRASRYFHADGIGPNGVWCPSLVPITDLRPMTRVLTFGMAHKIACRSYEQLRDLLEAAHGQEYVVGVSVAIHEGTDWQAQFSAVQAELTRVFGAQAHLFGALADAGVSATLQSSTAMAAFFEGGVRANNTTVWAALEHGVPVITNLDSYSPPDFVHGVNVFDIHQMHTWPSLTELAVVAHNGRIVAERYSWDRLVEQLR